MKWKRFDPHPNSVHWHRVTLGVVREVEQERNDALGLLDAAPSPGYSFGKDYVAWYDKARALLDRLREKECPACRNPNGANLHGPPPKQTTRQKVHEACKDFNTTTGQYQLLGGLYILADAIDEVKCTK